MIKLFLLIFLLHSPKESHLDFHKNEFNLNAQPVIEKIIPLSKPITIQKNDYVFGMKYHRVKLTIKPTLYRNPVSAIENLKPESEDAVSFFNDALSSVAKFDIRLKIYITKNFRLILRDFTQSKSSNDIYTAGIAWRF